jgi:epoxyqueuosine reductase QueG
MRMSLETEFTSELKKQGAHFVHFVDISHLKKEQNKGYPVAILLGIILSPQYLKKVTDTPEYVQKMKQNNEIDYDEFHLTELNTDRLADYFAGYLTTRGFSAYSQSEDNIFKTGYYNTATQTTPLPHKTIALLAGLGWIGKHNLLIMPEYGSAVSMCTVLTDAPLKAIFKSPIHSQCGTCNICTDICPVKALKGKLWDRKTRRDKIIDIYKCTTCIECLVFCPFTQAYMKKNLKF